MGWGDKAVSPWNMPQQRLSRLSSRRFRSKPHRWCLGAMVPEMDYMMRSQTDCGPAALSAVTGCPYDRVIAKWPGGWLGDDRGVLGVPNDTPWDHFAFLASMGIPWRVITLSDLLEGRFAGDKTMILMHRPGGFINATLKQHWGIVQCVNAEGICVHMGNKTVRTFDRETMSRAYADGWPACAYVVGEGSVGLSWWAWLVAKITGCFV